MSDLINRQDAIAVVEKWFKRIELNGDICLDGLRSLPSAQQEGKRMTREEAIKNINALNAVCWQKDFYDEEFEEALTLAIRNLEAWDKILKDVRRYELNCYFDADETTCKLCNNNVFGSIRSIIQKHLKEVEEYGEIH